MAAKSNKKRKKKKTADQRHLEIWGVVLIAVGLFLGTSLYSEAAGVVGIAVSGFIFGMLGLLAYAVPVVFVVGGILLIVNAAEDFKKSTIVFVLLALWVVLAVIHLTARPSITNVSFIPYGSDAYSLGQTLKQGGGILGAVLAWPMLYLLGESGSYIFFLAAFIILALIVTKISIKSAGEKVGEKIKEGIDTFSAAKEEHRAMKQELYTAELSAEEKEEPAPAAPKVYKKKSAKAEAQDTLNYRAESGEKSARWGEKDIDFLPMSGPIERQKKNRKINEDDPFDFNSLLEEHEKPKRVKQTKQSEPAVANEPNYAERITKYAEEDEKAKRSQTEVPGVAEPVSFPTEETAAPIAAPSFEFTPEDEEPPSEPIPNSASKPASEIARESSQDAFPVPDAETVDVPPVYQAPPITLLNAPKQTYARHGETPESKAKVLLETLASFNITAKLLNISVGPALTRFEIQPAQGIRVNRITTLSDDIALALAAPRVRIEAPIPGKAAVGIEVPNQDIATVLLREIIETKEFESAKSSITFALGKDIAGGIAIADLDRMPHLLIAGATGSGKSVCINDIIISMIYKSSPEELRLILVDPKVVELRMFSVLPHLLVPVVTEPKKAAGALHWAVMEMEQRYQKMAKANVRSLAGYNALQEDPAEKMPKLVIIIDELADLMMVAAKDVEESICRIAQLGRACGIHLIVATQRPSADIITGLIKANIPSRIAFAVSSAIDSRVILDASGAEKLLGRGDMLFHANGAGKPIRIQGAFVSDEEVERISNFFEGQQTQSSYNNAVLQEIATSSTPGAQGGGKQEDDLLPEAVKVVLDSGQASISMIQRRLRVGYARAARLVDIMEQKHIVSGFDGSKPRKLLITQAQYEQMFGQGSATEGETE